MARRETPAWLDTNQETHRRDSGVVTKASYVKRAKEFQRAFVEYFPDLADIEVALDEWSWLLSHWILNQIHTVRRGEALEELEDVIRAVRLLAKSDWWPWWGTIYDAQKAAEDDDADRVTQDFGSIAAALVELSRINLPNEDGAPVRLENALVSFREGAMEETSRLPDTGSINWRAVFAVDALRSVWWAKHGTRGSGEGA